MSTQTLFVQCGPGLEPGLETELRRLGFGPGRVEHGGLTLTDAPAGSAERLNLWSRVATRVLLRVAELRDERELQRLSLGAFGARFAIETSGLAANRWKAAAQRALPLGDGPLVLLRGHERGATLSVDTTGEPLYLRGFRQEIGRAPMRETLASGVLELAGWAPGTTLWDPVCGSGTLLLEAAERCAGLAPGRARPFAFERFPSHDAARFAVLARSEPPHQTALLGSDLNAGALGTARRNARRAGVVDLLTLERLDATRLVARPGVSPGLMVGNLPYGKRVGVKDELGRLYAGLGRSLRAATPGWRFAFLLEAGAEALGLPVDRDHPVSNGGLGCTLVVGTVPSA